MGEESAAEKVYEAGLELVNPGGDPGVLRDAATAWKAMGSALDKMVTDLDRDWRRVKGAGAWTGPSADAFDKHWQELKKAVEDTTPQCDNAAKHLNDAADSIEDINDQIHQIYLEIGVSIGVSVALSFVTVGFSAAAGAARAAQLAARAAQLAGRLGGILTRLAQSFRGVAQAVRGQRFIKTVLVNWAGNTGGSLITNVATGKKVGLDDVGEAVWTGGVGAIVGTGPGNLAGKAASHLNWGNVAQGAAAGATGNVVGGAAADGVKVATGEEVTGSEFRNNVAVNVVGGAAGGGATAGVYKGIDGAGAPVTTPPDTTSPENAGGNANSADSSDTTPDAGSGGQQNGPADPGYVPPSQRGPHFSIDGVIGGVTAGGAGAAGEPFTEDDESSARDKVRKDFG
jgi:WXG100 family type VII secretion target